jgi:hypothetical protein
MHRQRIVAQKIRDDYANDLSIANTVAKLKNDKLRRLIENLKLVEIKNTKSRMEQVSRLNFKTIKTTSH